MQPVGRCQHVAEREQRRAPPVFVRMKTPPRKDKDATVGKKDQDSTVGKRRSGAPESQSSNETFPHRTDPPGKTGLANEVRPGLGTRRETDASPTKPGDARLPDPEQENDDLPRRQRSGTEPNDKPLPRDPQEQRPDSWAQEEERDTGVSGHLGSG